MAAKKSGPDGAFEGIRDRVRRPPPFSPAPDGPDGVDIDAELYRLVGERVLMFRHRAALSQAVLAERVGVTRTSITHVEQGKQRPPLSILLRIASALGVPDYRDLMPTSDELAAIVRSPAGAAMAVDHPFWAHVCDVLSRTFSSPTERMSLLQANADFVEVGVEDRNPLRPGRMLIVVWPRPQPIHQAVVTHVAARMAELRVGRGILITSGAFEADAVAAAAAASVTLINGFDVANLRRALASVIGHSPEAVTPAPRVPVLTPAKSRGGAL